MEGDQKGVVGVTIITMAIWICLLPMMMVKITFCMIIMAMEPLARSQKAL